jgi:phenylalanyl-tRNA synthetase beta chain
VAIAGVMGGLHSEVDESTTAVLLECAWFDAKSIRATRRALGMSTDASYRFERGIDAEGMEQALERCIQLILAVAGGSLDGPVLDCGEARYEALEVPLRLSRIERVLGIPFDAEYAVSLLRPLGFALQNEENGTLTFRIPGFRSHDVRREIDLIEEIARTHGYDAFPQDLGAYRPGTVPDHPLFQLEDELRHALAAHGLFETQTPAFVPPGEGDVEVSNPLASTEPFMRRAVLPSLLRRLEYNLARGNRDVRLFELGTSFTRAGSGLPPFERPHIALALTGGRRPAHWSHAPEPIDAWDLKALVELVSRHAYRGSATVDVEQEGAGSFDTGSGFVVRDASGAVVGQGGRVPPATLDLPAWAGDVWGLELTLPPEPVTVPVPTHTPLPHFPAVERDLALIVPDQVAAGAVLAGIRAETGALLEDARPFDLYSGPGVPEGTRSIAFRLRFRARDRTLKDDEVDRSIEKLLGALAEAYGIRSRG